MPSQKRSAVILRATKETRIKLSIDIDGAAAADFL